MSNELLSMIEREVLGWPGGWKKRDEDGPGGVGVTGYRFGRPQIGHVHDDGHADFSFPREARDELIQTGQAIAHPAFPNSRTTVSSRIRSAEDVPKALELFRMNYERLKESAERQAEHRKERNGPAAKPRERWPSRKAPRVAVGSHRQR